MNEALSLFYDVYLLERGEYFFELCSTTTELEC